MNRDARIDSLGQPSPKPRGPWVMHMEWHELLFMHWPVPAELLVNLLPAGLQLDTREGIAWLGIVPFEMRGVRPRLAPGLPGISRFAELNVRTYAIAGGRPGVWFFSLDAASALAVKLARWSFHLNYLHADMDISRKGNSVAYSSDRLEGPRPARLRVSYRPAGPAISPNPGTLEHWLTARYCLYSADARGRLYRAEVDHQPWPLAPAEAEIEENSMAAPIGVALEGKPLLHYSRDIRVRGWLPEKAGD